MTGFWITNFSLAIFFFALVMAGFGRGLYEGASFQEMALQIRPFLVVFAISGIALMLGMWLVLWNAFRLLGKIISSANGEKIRGDGELSTANS